MKISIFGTKKQPADNNISHYTIFTEVIPISNVTRKQITWGDESTVLVCHLLMLNKIDQTVSI